MDSIGNEEKDRFFLEEAGIKIHRPPLKTRPRIQRPGWKANTFRGLV